MTLSLTRSDIAAIRARLALNGQAFIDGRLTDAASGQTFDDISPRDGTVIARVAACDAEDVDRAVRAARRAFEAGVWRDRSPKERKKVLRRFAELFETHMDELAVLETLDMGKPILESRTIDVNGVVCGRGRNPTLRLWPTIFTGEIDVLPSQRRDMGQQIGR